MAKTPLGQSGADSAGSCLTWESEFNSAHVPIEVGKFQSDSLRPNLMFFAILCVKMSPEGILSRLAKKHVMYSYCIVTKTPLGPIWR